MGALERLFAILSDYVPVFVAIVGIIPTIISNRKKTEASLKATETNISQEIRPMKQEIEIVKQNFSDHISEFDETKAKQARYRILRFYDEVCEGKKHSESHFEDVLDDIDFYETYCSKHPEFKNNRGHVAMEYVKTVYAKVKAEGGFLTHKDEGE